MEKVPRGSGSVLILTSEKEIAVDFQNWFHIDPCRPWGKGHLKDFIDVSPGAATKELTRLLHLSPLPYVSSKGEHISSWAHCWAQQGSPTDASVFLFSAGFLSTFLHGGHARHSDLFSSHKKILKCRTQWEPPSDESWWKSAYITDSGFVDVSLSLSFPSLSLSLSLSLFHTPTPLWWSLFFFTSLPSSMAFLLSMQHYEFWSKTR